MKLSYSQLDVFNRCPRWYEYAFVKKLKRPVSSGESFGSSIHNTLKKWGELELSIQNRSVTVQQNSLFADDNQDQAEKELNLDQLIDTWNKTFSIEGFKTKKEADQAKKKGVEILKHFYEWWSKEEHRVIAVEEGFSILVRDVRLSGRFDRVEKFKDGLRIIDFKTSKEKTKTETDEDLQLSIYALASAEKYKLPCYELMFLHLRLEGCAEIKTQRKTSDLIKAKEKISVLKIKIESGDFDPSPGLICKNCPFNRICEAALI